MILKRGGIFMNGNYDKKVAMETPLKNISEVAKKYGIPANCLKPSGQYVAKVDATKLKETANKKNGKLVLITSITPTQLGEGKTVNTIGLGMALNKLGHKAISCVRQPSLGPIFGMKGGATGGGLSQILPSEDISLYGIQDAHAVSSAQNLCAAVLDNNLYWNNTLDIDKDNVIWHRVLDVNDRVLRNVVIGGGGKVHGVNRKAGFDITAASECMAILSLAKDLKDLRERLDKVVIGYTLKGAVVTVKDLKVGGAMAVLMREALNPNIVQTSENTACFVHTGPFANISHGSSSVIADLTALRLADFVVTEAGFGADLGAEKFFDIKCRQSGIVPSVAVINCSVRALKLHSNDYLMKGVKLPDEIKRENLSAVDRGCSNLEKQIENLKMFGVPVVVCINHFESDTKKEIDLVINRANTMNVAGVAVSDVYKMGSIGGLELAKLVLEASKTEPKFHYLYPLDMGPKHKIERIAKSMYGAGEVTYTESALKEISLLEKAKLGGMPICIAKNHLSLSNNPKKKGRPRGFTLEIDNVEPFAGAGYIVARAEGVNTMPGLPEKMRIGSIDIDVKTGQIKGLF
ncbi:formate--tetrahydrofolate ligase [Candidatus Omnitrophus magneticus]|uniref:Formate--tetrahydrofolate ligase n=1 Tax=Candidatus Omnitrophus magneticus TaxID=1609969 RepID=A0A0F0CJ42_9BACT|nr:formate--tetrahydrofolate ligase [Candidatus Omnitrophus magneticus]